MFGIDSALVKTVSILAGVAILVFAGNKGLTAVYDAGYEKARAETKDYAIQESAKAVAKAQAQWKLSSAAGAAQIVVEEKIVERVHVVEKKIPGVVQTVAADCRDLGPAVRELFNDAVNASNSDPTGATVDTSEPDEPVPDDGSG